MTSWRLLYEPAAFYEVRGLPEQHCRRMIDALESLAATGVGNVKCLVNRWPREYRLRVGDYRAIFARETDGEGRYMVVKAVFFRGEGYE